MLFQTIKYALLLLVVWTLFWTVLKRHRTWRHVMLLAASYVFYCSWDMRFAALLLFSTALDYFLGAQIAGSESARKRRICLILSLIGNLGVLAAFKYFNFFMDNFNILIANLGLEPIGGIIKILPPVGISFYTFQSLS